MTPKKLTDALSIASQISAADVETLAAQGFKAIVCNRPDGEGSDQPSYAEVEKAARSAGLAMRWVPVMSGKVTDENVSTFASALDALPKPVLAYCRTGTRSASLWALSESGKRSPTEILALASKAGFDVSAVLSRLANGGHVDTSHPAATHDIVIVGGGAAGLAVAASLLKRKKDLDIAVIEPADTHYYQPGFTMVGGGVFSKKQTAKSMGAVLPRRVTWIKAAVAGFEPDANAVVIEGCRTIRYKHLVVCPGSNSTGRVSKVCRRRLGRTV